MTAKQFEQRLAKIFDEFDNFSGLLSSVIVQQEQDRKTWENEKKKAELEKLYSLRSECNGLKFAISNYYKGF